MTSATRPNKFNGFTLVELILVVLICALLAALVFPAVRKSWGHVARSSSSADVVRLLRQARLRSSADETTYHVRFEKGDKNLLPAVYAIAPDASSKRVEDEWASAAGEIDCTFVTAQATPVEVLPEMTFTVGRCENPSWLIINDEGMPDTVIRISAPSGAIGVEKANASADAATLADKLRAENVSRQQAAKQFWQDNFEKVLK